MSDTPRTDNTETALRLIRERDPVQYVLDHARELERIAAKVAKQPKMSVRLPAIRRR